jgi:hypothetical protein
MSVDVKPGPELETRHAVALFDSGLRPSGVLEQFCMSPDGTKLCVPVPVDESEKPMASCAVGITIECFLSNHCATLDCGR